MKSKSKRWKTLKMLVKNKEIEEKSKKIKAMEFYNGRNVAKTIKKIQKT